MEMVANSTGLSLILIGPKTMCWVHADVNAIAHGRGGVRTYCC